MSLVRAVALYAALTTPATMAYADDRAQLYRCADVLMVHEGFSSTEYRCPKGYGTIGYGHRIKPGEELSPLTRNGAWHLLIMDIVDARNGAKTVFPSWETLPPRAQDTIICMTFQLGAKGVSKFVNFRRAISIGDWVNASKECMLSEWARQTPVRAEWARDQFLSLGVK